VKLVPEVDGDRRVDGVVAAVGGDDVTVQLPDGGDRVVRLAEVDRARTVFEWGPAPKPGGPKGGKGSTAGGKSVSGRTKENHT
jgi:ribosome maturation factor RimP